jgi:hypothetical protein
MFGPSWREEQITYLHKRYISRWRHRLQLWRDTANVWRHRHDDISTWHYMLRYVTSLQSRHNASIPQSKPRRCLDITKNFQTKEMRFIRSILSALYLFEIRCHRLSSLKFPFVPVSSQTRRWCTARMRRSYSLCRCNCLPGADRVDSVGCE